MVGGGEAAAGGDGTAAAGGGTAAGWMAAAAGGEAAAGGGTAAAGGGGLAGRVVALDPGHGARASSRLVPDGRGGRKACDTSGTATNSGYAERDFTLDVAKRTAKLLRARGVTVRMTRTKTLAKELCVDRRGKFAQKAGAELMVSIHGDGNANPEVKGYFAIVSGQPKNAAQGAPSRDLAKRIVKRLGAAGFTRNQAYRGGISKRNDLGGINHATRPAVMMELGEMRNPAEAKLMASKKGRQRYAKAVAAGIVSYLKAHPEE
jgi:N-acetylmuramoyl-L-alanine amidase